MRNSKIITNAIPVASIRPITLNAIEITIKDAKRCCELKKDSLLLFKYSIFSLLWISLENNRKALYWQLCTNNNFHSVSIALYWRDFYLIKYEFIYYVMLLDFLHSSDNHICHYIACVFRHLYYRIEPTWIIWSIFISLISFLLLLCKYFLF